MKWKDKDSNSISLGSENQIFNELNMKSIEDYFSKWENEEPPTQ